MSRTPSDGTPGMPICHHGLGQPSLTSGREACAAPVSGLVVAPVLVAPAVQVEVVEVEVLATQPLAPPPPPTVSTKPERSTCTPYSFSKKPLIALQPS